MTALAALLLLMVAATHYGPDLLAAGYPDELAARRALYYVARSFEGAAQYALLAWVCWGWARATEPRRLKGPAPAIPSMLVVWVCGVGCIEHLQAGACRLAIGITNRPPPVQPLAGLCGDLGGVPLYMLGLGASAFLAATIAAHIGERQGHG